MPHHRSSLHLRHGKQDMCPLLPSTIIYPAWYAPITYSPCRSIMLNQTGIGVCPRGGCRQSGYASITPFGGIKAYSTGRIYCAIGRPTPPSPPGTRWVWDPASPAPNMGAGTGGAGSTNLPTAVDNGPSSLRDVRLLSKMSCSMFDKYRISGYGYTRLEDA